MCGGFSQSMTREQYLAILADEAEEDIPYNAEPIGRYNVAPGIKVLLLSERDEQLHLDPEFWGYAPGWWDKPPLINARGETAMFKPLWQHGRAICFTDGWLSGERKATRNSPTSSTEPTATPYSWRRSAARRLRARKKKAF